MEIVWEDPPLPDGPFFTRDVYESAFAPSIHELFTFLHSPQQNSPPKVQSFPHSGALPTEEKNVERASIPEDSCDSEEDFMETEDAKGTEEVVKSCPTKKVPFPEPRVPYPCISALSKTEQRKYSQFLCSRKQDLHLPEMILNKVNQEVMQFMMYLQDVSRRCAEDYNIISQGALQYSEEVFRSWLGYIKTLPEVYQIHELTSLTGGKFNPALSLTFEKELLHMGSVVMTGFRPVQSDTVLASDYPTVSSHTPPAKKAKELHTPLSNDSNAERLCSSYEPHVCLTRDALVQLLNNHGPDFREEWELPVLIKSNPSKDKNPRKTVFIDSPLPKSEVTLRERNHIYHEQALKLSVIRTEIKDVVHVMTELPISEQSESGRTLSTLENDSIDFEVDLSDLETFGENASNKAANVKKAKMNQDGARVKSEKAISQNKGSRKNESTSLDEELDSNQCESVKDKVTQNVATPLRKDFNWENASHLLSGDSDDDNLIIADTSPKDDMQQKQCETPSSSSPSSNTRSAKQKKKTPPSGDQLGEILQMQTAMFTSNPSNVPSKSTNSPQDTSTPSRLSGPTHLHPTSLVKACVSSYLERNPSQEEETGDAFHNVAAESTGFKKLLSQDLQAANEDERDYESPEEGNVFYKLYSLDKLMLMVRTSIDFTRTKKLDNQDRCVPLNILPKLEYQLTYGVECLSSSEACQLWTETLLHSSTESFIAHIDALTSRVALVRKLPDNWIYNTSCGFKPSKSLNILHHVLQKLTGLDEGQYLLRHKVGEPFVNILKAAQGNGRQGVYNLQQIHSDIPPPPTLL
uniref:Interactor of little elongator complex ELL subunit 2 n=2 Tax=Neogobius melanostomus TaxID=47308 RepID=A0A8C6SW75_9GOBI